MVNKMTKNKRKAVAYWAFDKPDGETVIMHKVYSKSEDKAMRNMLESLMWAAGHGMQSIESEQSERTGLWSIIVCDDIGCRFITDGYETKEEAIESLIKDGIIYKTYSKDGKTIDTGE